MVYIISEYLLNTDLTDQWSVNDIRLGEKIASGSGVLLLLGVAFAVTTVVAAAILLGSTTLNKTAYDHGMTVNKGTFSPSGDGTDYTDLVSTSNVYVGTTYDLSVSFTTSAASPGGYYQFIFTGSGITTNSPYSVTMQVYDPDLNSGVGGWTSMTSQSYVAGTITFTFAPGELGNGLNSQGFAITYVNGGQFNLDINIQSA